MAAPLTTLLARGLVSTLQFTTPVQMDDDLSQFDGLTCDDELPMFEEKDGEMIIRETCTRQGCGVRDEVCYFDDYFERCLDRYGRPTGECHVAAIACHGWLACTALWFDCVGQYACSDPALVGCHEGSCVQPDAQ